MKARGLVYKEGLWHANMNESNHLLELREKKLFFMMAIIHQINIPYNTETNSHDVVMMKINNVSMWITTQDLLMLKYGENPHQRFERPLRPDECFTQQEYELLLICNL